MQKEPYRVSILVPVYGVEKYIERCAKALFEQTYQNIEFVFVNDCTKDSSIDVLNEVITRYPKRVNDVIVRNHTNNRGIASTRNTALDNCNGEFLIFVDSDDWVDPNMIERLVSIQEENDYDVVTCDYKEYSSKGVDDHHEQMSSSTREMMESLIKGKSAGRIWGRLVRTSIVKKNGLRFVDGANFAEDDMMMTLVWFYAKEHKLLNECLYYYERRNVSSYTNSFNYKNSIESLTNLDNVRLFFKKNAPHYLEDVNYQELEKISGHMILCCKNESNREYYNEVLLKRLSGIEKKYRKQLPLNNMVAVTLRHFDLVRLYVMIGVFLKRITR